MHHLTRLISLNIIILITLFTSCSTDEEVAEGAYVYTVMAKFEGSPEELSQIKVDIDTMLGKIPGIIEWVSGYNDSEKGKYNYGLTVKFKDKAAREAYSSNPHHKAAVAKDRGNLIVVEMQKVTYEVNPAR